MPSTIRLGLLAALATILVGVSAARADYVVASRHALVKSDPQRNADTIFEIEAGAALNLAADTQTDGYYKVTLDDGSRGWVYRTFVRRFQGKVPAASGHATHGSADPTSSGASETAAVAGTSKYAYHCLPVSTSAQYRVTVLQKEFFTIGYSDKRRNPLWVCYAIGPVTDPVAYKRKRFATDNDTTAKVSHDDYTKEDYSRGHMAPRFAISSRFGKPGNDATFIMSNVCPQFQSFNDGHWGNLEEWIAGKKLQDDSIIAGWADEYEKVWVTVGPIFDKDREPMTSGIEVPNAFYCIVIDEQAGKPRAMAFMMDHIDSRAGVLKNDLCTIRDIERRTGLDFFSCLPPEVEGPLETTKAADLWPLPKNPN